MLSMALRRRRAENAGHGNQGRCALGLERQSNEASGYQAMSLLAAIADGLTSDAFFVIAWGAIAGGSTAAFVVQVLKALRVME
jgi:hypothetical protein